MTLTVAQAIEMLARMPTGAKLEKITRERVRQIAKGAGITGRNRHHTRKQEWIRAIKNAEPDTEVMRIVCGAAKEKELPVELVIATSHARFSGDTVSLHSRSRVMVNGKRCAVRVAEVFFTPKGGKRKYARFSEAAKDAEFAILVCPAPTREMFIVPRKIIKGRFVYAPMNIDAPVYRNILPKIDWKRYLNNWEQLR